VIRLDARLKRLEKSKPNDLQALSDAELDARIAECWSGLLATYGTVDSLLADCEPHEAALVRWHIEQAANAQRAPENVRLA
jgi:hypothetical protein